MKTHQEKFIPAFEVPPGMEETAFGERLQDIVTAAESVRGHLARYADTIDNNSLRKQAEALRTWMDINAEGLGVAARVAQLGPVWADEIHTRLDAAARDLDRIAREDMNFGAPAPSDAGRDLIRVWNDVNGILGSMEALYPQTGIQGEPEKVVEPVQAFAR